MVAEFKALPFGSRSYKTYMHIHICVCMYINVYTQFASQSTSIERADLNINLSFLKFSGEAS